MSGEVSVIIPVFNGERFLGEALDSALAQAPPPLEVIVVDDGSTDGSASVAESRAGVRCLRLDHVGVSGARNHAIAEARGEWIAFLDADDRWLPGKLACQLEAARLRPEVSLFLGSKRIFFDGPPAPWYDGPGEGEELPSYEPSVWMVKRSAFDAAGLFDTAMAIGEDTDWLARAADAGLRSHVCEQVLTERRIHADNASGIRYDRKGLMLGILRDSVRRKRPLTEESR